MATITKETVIAMREEINAALKTVGAKYGVILEAGNATFTELECTYKLIATVRATADFDPQKAIWEQNAPYVGLPKDAYGKSVRLNGTVYSICGYDTKARTNKILIAHQDKIYKADVSTIKKALEAAASADTTIDANHSGAEKANNKEPDDFDIKAFICGLKGKCHYGQIFTVQGKQYRLVDFNTKAPQYPLICEDVQTGKSYRLPKSVLES